MDFSLDPAHEEVCRKVGDFVAEHALPAEADRSLWNEYDNIRLAERDRLRDKAKAAGLWAPQMPRARGGLGLPMVGQAAFYETASRSVFGPAVLNCAAPDDGNMRLLEQVAAPQQKDRWLQPIVDGTVNSAFAMTEPAPGAGSDPSMMLTTAERRGGSWVVHGRKWFISGAGVARHFILIARTDPDPRETRRHLTAFLFDRDQPGWRILRRIPNMGPEEHGGVCELAFEGLEIPDEDRLMAVGDGLKVTQIRLGPARLTHCMRWLGLAKRCMEIAADYVARREGFGVRLAERESVQIKLAEVAQAIHAGRLLVMHAAWKLDQGDFARKEVSMAKIHVADTLQLAADTALQLLGARGYSKDTVVEWIYRYARCARLVDGATEVHRQVLARAYRQEGDRFWRWGA
jgi:acyl-CoA dehydrogenase